MQRQYLELAGVVIGGLGFVLIDTAAAAAAAEIGDESWGSQDRYCAFRAEIDGER